MAKDLPETAPLLGGSPASEGAFNPIRRVMLVAFVIASSFAFTQSPLIYAFRLMTCDEYYKTHAWTGAGDRCAIPRIEADTASSVALVGATTMTFTIINVFVTGWFIKRFGVKAALFQQTGWAAARNLTQIYAQTIGGGTGILIIQCTQVFNVLGSGGGYQLAANAFIAVLAKPEERTGLFGMLGGISMLGGAAGYILGGLSYRYLGYLAPFEITFGLLVFSTFFGLFFLPYIPPESQAGSKTVAAPSPNNDAAAESAAPAKPKPSGMFGPLSLFRPKLVTLPSGRSKRDWNLFLLGAGAFFSVFATGYVPMALQLVGTNVFGFQPTESGIMLSWALLMKAFFLSICFPRIIASGRKLLSSRSARSSAAPNLSSSSSSATLVASPSPSSAAPAAIAERPDSPSEAEVPSVTGAPREELARQPTDKAHGSTFDLLFLQWSIFLDGLLTAGVALSNRGMHMYIAASILPFASGTGPAAKGVTLDFVPPEQRADALAGIALIEKLAYVSTIGVFGYVFSFLSEIGHPMLIFVANAAVAMIGFLLLIPVRMPREGQLALA